MRLPITTERLILRRYTYDDMKDILELVSHSSVARIVSEIEATEAGVRKYIDVQNSYQPFEQGKCFDLAIERKESTNMIGLLSLICKEHKQAAIGWALGQVLEPRLRHGSRTSAYRIRFRLAWFASNLCRRE
jgi:RimJ/RimL family protein N-acetyltransferase